MLAYPDMGAFTFTLRYAHPEMNDYEVIGVDAGLDTDPNLVMFCSKIDNGKLTGDPYTFIISKLWVFENIENILRRVPEDVDNMT